MSTPEKDALNLPVTQFPMRGNLAQREPQRLEHWDKIDLYGSIQRGNASGKAFILHDGPPFTNGDIHMGHVLNKTLKDIILRYKSMQGCRTPYIVGWDCHGLPIEHAVTKDLRAKGQSLSPVEVRSACAAFSERFIGIQSSQFKRLGVLFDKDRDYRTMSPSYEADILRTFASFVDKGLVYRSKKPVYWSIPCATALAEAEIEYQEKTSQSIWVKFPVRNAAKLGLQGKVSVVIWTTTPWTLPANLAIAVHPRLEYVALSHSGETFIVAAARAEAFAAECELKDLERIASWQGTELDGVTCRHPFIERHSPIILADYVTTDAGSGCVHTAPGHGLEDYQSGLKYHLGIYCPLDDAGRYVEDGQIPTTLVGISVLEQNGRNPANDAVLALLKETGALLKRSTIRHQYPHCWRSKTPVIFRAMDQWFVSLDHGGMRAKVLEAIGQVKWIPSWGENRIRGAVESRPDWCVSRQRAWGVPLPAFYDENGQAFLDADVIRGVADKIEKHGTNLWFSASPRELLEGITLPRGWEASKLRCGTDTLDVWIDSGTSHRAVLKRYEGLHWPADLYLEGSDQHRGWFQSSLWTAMIADGAPPYRTVLTHGFMVNDQGRKLSKSDGAKPATEIMKTDGADVLRLAIANTDYSGDIPFSNAILTQVGNTYRLFRNTLRFLLGNLSDFDPARHTVAAAALLPVDKWALHETAILVREVTAFYESYEFHKAVHLLNNFCSNTLSAVYHDLLKDRLYTWGRDSRGRRSAQTVLNHIFDTLNGLLAPMLVFTTDEAYAHRTTDSDLAPDSIHLKRFPTAPAEWLDEAVHGEIEALLGLRPAVNEKLEALRQQKLIGQGIDAFVAISAGSAHPLAAHLAKHADQLAELFLVSRVVLESNPDAQGLAVAATQGTGCKCPRCWRWLADWTPASPEEPCPRCQASLNTPG